MALPEPSMEKGANRGGANGGGQTEGGQRENGTNGEEHNRIKKPLL